MTKQPEHSHKGSGRSARKSAHGKNGVGKRSAYKQAQRQRQVGAATGRTNAKSSLKSAYSKVAGKTGALKTERADIVVVGAGASGIACAITAARSGRKVLVLEADDDLGRSIKRTGDGRCNIANARTDAGSYRNAAFVGRAFETCSPADALAFLESCGIVMRAEAQGRMYPQANKATSVVDALLATACDTGVQVRANARVVQATAESNGYVVRTAEGEHIRCHALAVCTGGASASGLLPADIPQIPFEPVLGPLACDPAPLRGLDKLRAKCALTCRGVREQGEATFRTYGVSGIAAFNLSRIACPGDLLAIDFLPELAGETGSDPGADQATQAFLEQRLGQLGPCTWQRFCTGMLLPLIARAVLRSAHLRESQTVRKDDLPEFGCALRAFPLTVRGIGDERLCQVHRGGVNVAAVDPCTMEISGHPRLYVCGEALDVDAPCGGYNLHWAWTSGILAGKAASSR